MSVLLTFFFCEGCSSPPETTPPGTTETAKPTVMAEKPFASGGKIHVELDGGSYTVRPAAGEHIRVTFSGNAGKARAELTTNGAEAHVGIKDTPSNNFQATIEVPVAADLVVRLSAGNLEIAAIPGNKDVESIAGNVDIAVGDPNRVLERGRIGEGRRHSGRSVWRLSIRPAAALHVVGPRKAHAQGQSGCRQPDVQTVPVNRDPENAIIATVFLLNSWPSCHRERRWIPRRGGDLP